MARRDELTGLLERYKDYPDGYYHIVFDNLETSQLFDDPEDFAEGMNAVAIEQYLNGIIIEIFNIMINHAHVQAYCNGRKAISFFIGIKRRLNVMLRRKGKKPLSQKYSFKLIRIETLEQRMSTAAYIARNPYKARRDLAPSGYIYGSNYLMFSEIDKMLDGIPLSSFSTRKMRELFKTAAHLPGEYIFSPKLGFILPQSYVHPEYLMKAFGSAQSYCHSLIRNNDAFLKIAEGIGEAVQVDDHELGYIIWSITKNEYGAESLAEVPTEGRLKMAVTLRKKYRIDTKRICRKLSLPLKVVQELLD